MAADERLAALLREDLAALPGVVEKRMFGGLAFMHRGNMVCATYRDRAMYRVGKAQEAGARALSGTGPMDMAGRPMPGMVEALPAALADDAVRRRLLALAVAFTGALPAK